MISLLIGLDLVVSITCFKNTTLSDYFYNDVITSIYYFRRVLLQNTEQALLGVYTSG